MGTKETGKANNSPQCNMIAKRDDDAGNWNQDNWSYKWTEDWDQRTLRRPSLPTYNHTRGDSPLTRW
jgi:hypothetical protein